MLKIKEGIDMKVLKKFGFKEVLQDKRVNYIYMPHKVWENCGNHIIVFNDTNLYNLDRYIGEDRRMKFRFNELASEEFDKTVSVLFELIQAGIVVKE